MTTLSRRKILKSGALVTLSIALPTGNSLQARGQKMRVQTNDPLLSLSLNESAALIRSKALSAVELTEAVISGAEQLSSLHAYITFEPELLRRQARAADQAVKQGAKLGPLHGVPVILKDNINTAQLPTSGGTPGLKGNVPGTDAPVAARLFAAGALLAGKANMHELSTGGTSNNLTFGAVGNPYDPDRVPGGSSGGTAAAVAARMIAGGLGTDTGGSVRVPAALCGVTGLRPSSGRYPSSGIVPLSSTLDTAGPIARDVNDVALLDAVLANEDHGEEIPPVNRLRLGVPGDELLTDTSAAIKQNYQDTLTRLRAQGVTLIPVDLTEIRQRTPKIIGGLIGHEFRAALAAYLEQFAPHLSVEELTNQIADKSIKGMLKPPADPAKNRTKLQHMLTELRPALVSLHKQLFRENALDALIFPTTPKIALPRFGENGVIENDKAKMAFLYFTHTSLASAAGTPSLTLPSGLTTEGLPTGICLDGLPGTDRRIIGIGRAIERLLS